MKTVTLDIETIANASAMIRAGYEPQPGEFAPWPLHEIACASLFSVERSGFEEPRFDLRSFSRGHMGEAAIIANVERSIENAQQIITYNGQAFDLPVLVTRAVVHDLHVPTLARLSDRCRPGLHLDLHDRVKGAGPGVKLAHLCAAFGIPAKEGGTGECVANLAAAEDWVSIEQYCETDVIATWLAAQMWDSRDLPGNGLSSWRSLRSWLADSPTSNRQLDAFGKACSDIMAQA